MELIMDRRNLKGPHYSQAGHPPKLHDFITTQSGFWIPDEEKIHFEPAFFKLYMQCSIALYYASPQNFFSLIAKIPSADPSLLLVA